jgi:hypothetical protein
MTADCPGTNPNAALFVCVNGGWVPRDHPTAVHAPAPPSTHDFMPPSADEFEDVETIPGSGHRSPVLVRTADPNNWFVDGVTYRHPYGFVVRVSGLALRRMDGTWRWCHRLVIIDSPGSPGVGHVLYARLFAPRSNWTEVPQ